MIRMYYVVKCRYAYAGLQYAYAISTGRSGAPSGPRASTGARACNARVPFASQILFRVAGVQGMRGGGEDGRG